MNKKILLYLSLTCTYQSYSYTGDYSELQDNQTSNNTSSYRQHSIQSLHTNLESKELSLYKASYNAVNSENKLPPFVQKLPSGEVIIADDIEEMIPTLVNMAQLTYLIGREDTENMTKLMSDLQDDGWEIRTFKGFSGLNNSVEDVPGFVAYNRHENYFTIALRGSMTKAHERGRSADWQVNFDYEFVNMNNGAFHRGFYLRSQALVDNIIEQLKYFYDTIPANERQNARITVTGHSQGSALATLIAAMIVDPLKKQGILAPNFDNNKSNTITAFILSAPRIGDENALEWTHNIIGVNNIVRLNVEGDLVPILSPGKTVTKIIKLLPNGTNLAKKLGGKDGAVSVGILALDDTISVLSRNLKAESMDLGYRYSKRTVKALPLYDPSSPNFIIQTLGISTIDLLQTLLAPLHYGGTGGINNGQALFNPNAIINGLNIVQAIKNGEQKKVDQQTGKRKTVDALLDKGYETKMKLKEKAKKIGSFL